MPLVMGKTARGKTKNGARRRIGRRFAGSAGVCALVAAVAPGSNGVMFSPEAESLVDRAADFHRALHAWYDAYHRLLPWREVTSPYRTVVSEFMCQQTQVDTVIPYFNRWVAEWPDFTALAEADEAAVMKAWEGLGYYRRARNLHALAREVVLMAAPPHTADGWIELPGVGAYTAAAIASIAYGDAVAVVDGNVVRVLTRLTGDTRVFKDNGAAVKAVEPLATALIDEVFPGDYNQALMELGATICFRRKPLCALCPVREFCAADARKNADDIPRLLPKATEKIAVNRLFARNADGALLLRRYEGGAATLAGLCELPEATGLVPIPDEADLLAVKKRAITTRQYTESIYACAVTPAFVRRVARDKGLFWAGAAELGTITLSGPHRKWVEELTASGK